MLQKQNASPNTGNRQRLPLCRGLGLGALLVVVVLAGALWLQRGVMSPQASGIVPSSDQGQGTLPAIPASPTTGPVQATPAASGALTSADEVQRIGPAEAKALLDKGEAVLYDVRSADSFQTKHAAGAISLPQDQIESRLSTLPKGKALILYCT